MLNWRRKRPLIESGNPLVGATEGSAAIGRDNIQSPILQNSIFVTINNIASAKGVPGAPCRRRR